MFGRNIKEPEIRQSGAKWFRSANKITTTTKKFKVRQPQRAAKSKRPNAPSDGSKNNGIHTTKQEEYPSRHPTTDTANSSTSKQSTSRRLMGVSKNTIHSNYQLPNGPVKAGRRWGQRHPQGANLGSNGIHNFMSKLKQWLPPAHPKSLASQCMSGQPISTCHALTS